MDIQNDDGSVDPYYSAFVEQKGLTPIIPKNSNLPSVIPQHQTKHQTKNPQYEAKPPPIIPKKDFKPPPMIPQIETKPPSIIPKIEVKPPSIIPQYEVKPPKIKHTPVINNVNLRPIIIDGSNVARHHGKEYGDVFSCKGIKLAIEYFLQKGHKVEAYIPRKIRHKTIDRDILDEYEQNGVLKLCPFKSYDDRFIVDAAIHHDGVIVSNDQYRDLLRENPEYKNKLRLLEFVFSGDHFMVPHDPLGKNGPKLVDYLSIKSVQKYHPIDATTARIQKKTDAQKYENFEMLKNMFPDNEEIISELVFNKYPNESNVSFFVDVLISSNKLEEPKISHIQNEASANWISDSNKTTFSNYSKSELKPITTDELRMLDKTEQIKKQLCEIFPSNIREIERTLSTYQYGTDIEYLIDKLIQLID